MDFFWGLWYSFNEWKMIIMFKKIKFKRNSSPDKRKFTMSETILLVAMTLVIGILLGSLLYKTNIITKKTILNDQNLIEFVENYNYILNNYYKEIDEKELIGSAIAGMMESLDDPYSMYFDKNESENFSITLDGSYQGVGVQVLKNEEDGNILITSVFKNSPAEIAGLKAGDIIIEIDGESVSKYSAEEFSQKVKNGQTEIFKLKILREHQEIDVVLKKSLVTLASVTSEIYEKNDKKIGYIYIGIFANNTYFQFKDALDELEKEKITSLIIDVRGNTGGHLTAVDSILDIFLTKNQKMYGFEQNGKREFIYGTGTNNKEYSIVLLGDEVSASASEVLIAGLKENLDAKFFGKKTYGKGTVQEMMSLTDGSQYKITIKKWLTPKGNWIDDTKGIMPDKEIDLEEKYFETYNSEDDSQLNYAIKYLSE